VLDNVEPRRAALSGRPKLRLTLDSLPDDGQCIRFDEQIYRTITSMDRFEGGVVLRDLMAKLMEGLVDAGVAAWLAGLASYPDAQFTRVVEQLGPVTTVLELRWPVAATAR
jgi:hypothetical protein